MKRVIWFSVFLSAGLELAQGPAALAQGPVSAVGPQLEAKRYLEAIGKPPAAGSLAEAHDLAILRWNQRTRTAEGILHSWRFLNRNLSPFEPAIGSDLAKTAPMLSKALVQYLAQVDSVKDQLKDSLARPRPFISHGEFKPCLPLEGG